MNDRTPRFREAFADYLRGQSSWRWQKAAEYPDDPRNEQCAAGLEVLANYVAGRPSTDERLLQLDALTKYTEWELDVVVTTIGTFDLGEEIGRFRFHGREGDALWSPDAYLSHLVDRAAEEGVRSVSYSGEEGEEETT